MSVLSKESAAAQVQSLLDYYEFKVEDLPSQLRMAMEGAVRQVEQGIMNGRIEVEVSGDSCVVKQHLKKPVPGAPNPIVYQEVSGRAKLSIRDDSTTYGKIYGFLGALSSEGSQIYQSMKGKDLSLAEALGSLFLQV